jgi:hypothetical protein
MTKLIIAFRNFAKAPKKLDTTKETASLNPLRHQPQKTRSIISVWMYTKERSPSSEADSCSASYAIWNTSAYSGTDFHLTQFIQSIPKKRITLPYITRSTKCPLSFIHSHIHKPHVPAIQLLFQHVKAVLRYAVSLTASEQATTTSAGCRFVNRVENLKGFGIRNFTSRLFWTITGRNLNFIMSSCRLWNIDINVYR